MQPSRLYIDSSDRSTYQDSSDFTIRFGNNNKIENVRTIQMDSLIFPNSLYSINSNNNILYLSMRRYDTLAPTTYIEQMFPIPIDEGHYTPNDIVNILPTLIENCYSEKYPSHPLFSVQSVTYNEITKRFSIDVAPNTYGRASSTLPGGTVTDWFLVLDETYEGYPTLFKNTLNYVLGFEKQAKDYPQDITNYIDTVISFENVSQVLHRLSGISYVYLHTNIITSALSSQANTNASTILSKISLPNEYGDVLYSHFGNSNDIIEVNQSSLDQIRFWITDSSFEILNLNGSDFSFSLLLNYYN